MLELNFESEQLDNHIERVRNDQPIGNFSLQPFDNLIGGIRNGRLTIISGEPGAAKTTLIGQLADDAAANGFVVLLNSLEVASHQLLSKSIARLSKGEIAVSDVSTSLESETALAAIEDYRSSIAPNICIIDRPCTAIELSAAVGQLKNESNRPVVLFHDYVQIMPSASEQSFMDERLAVKESVSGLRRIANTHDIPVFAISSVNRTSYGKNSVGLDCLGQSSSVEYGADSVLFLNVEGKGQERVANMALPQRPVLLSALKNRYSKTGTSKLTLDTAHALFSERA